MIDTIKKSANKQESFLNRLSNSKTDSDSIFERRDTKQSLLEISTSSSMMREEQPLKFDVNTLSNDIEALVNTKEDDSVISLIPEENTREIKNLIMKPKMEQGNILQNSILNINEDFRENPIENFFTESNKISLLKIGSFESSFDVNLKVNDPNLSKKLNSYLLSTKKLQDLRSKLYRKGNNSTTFINSSPKNHKTQYEMSIHDKQENNLNKFKESSYKQMLNRVREKSQEQAMKVETKPTKNQENKNNMINNHRNKYLISSNTNNFEIVKISEKIDSIKKSKHNFEDSLDHLNSNKNKLDFEDEQLISILNTNSSSKTDFNTLRKKQDLKESSLDLKSNFYEENLFELIDEIETRDKVERNKICEGFHKIDKNKNILIDCELEKRYKI